MHGLATLEPDTDTTAADNHGARVAQTGKGALISADELEFFAPTNTGALDTLIAQYRQTRKHIETVAEFMTGPDMLATAGFFFEASRERFGRTVPSVDRVFDADAAAKALDAHYWNRALDLTDVRDCMPAARRKEWNEQIQAMDTPEFTEDTVKATITGLLSQRLHFLSERVDGIFRGLSGEHVTNRPEGFSRRMIIDNAFSTCFSDIIFGGKSDLIHDLRSVVAKFMGRDQPGYHTTRIALSHFRRRTGAWFEMDGGALRVRVYKKGTAHMEVHPDIAWRLNKVLAHLYPAAIPSRYRQRPAKKKSAGKTFRLIERPIPFAALNPISEGRLNRDGVRWILDIGFSSADKHSRREIRHVLEAIGGVDRGLGTFHFDYNAGNVISELVTLGALPD